jgi:hypothetical protein
LAGDARDEFFFVIPSAEPIGEKALRDLLGEIKQEILPESVDAKERSRAVREWLMHRYPHTFLIRLKKR